MSIRSRFLICFLLTLIWYSCSTGTQEQQEKAKTIDVLVKKYIELDKFNGCLLVVMDHQIIYERSYGIANPVTKEQLTPDHRFRLASVTKQFTGIAITILKERGKLGYDDNIRMYLQELPYEGITIRHLLTHTSGLPDYGSLLDQYWDTTVESKRDRKIANNYTVYEHLNRHRPPVLFQPGEQYKYCNTGYNLLALIIERVSGQTYQEFMLKNVFEPLEMESTFVNDGDGTLPENLRARGFRYNLEDTGYVDIDRHYQNGMFGDGGIYSTVTDMFKYDQALYKNTLVSQKSFQDGVTASKLNNGEEIDYGFGWSLIKNDRGKFVAHGGGWNGFSTFFLRDYHHGNMIIQLTNRPGIRRGELTFAIYEILHDGQYDMPKGSIASLMLKEINKTNVESAIKTYYEIKRTKFSDYDFSESELNSLGYLLLRQNRIEEAIRIFKENMNLFPDSWNAYDSLAEAYMKNNDKEQAIHYYKESLGLNPENENAETMLKKIHK